MSSRFDNRRRERIEEQMSSIFGGNWADGSQANDRYESDIGFLMDGPSRIARPRHVRIHSLDSDSDLMLGLGNNNDFQAPTPAPPFHITRMNPVARQSRHTPTPNEDTPSSRIASSRRGMPMILSPVQQADDVINRFNRSERESALAQASWGDGLGDRERSLSPEVWDTLLTTLTPDPQPPSANTSFASAAPTSGPSQGSVSTATTLPPPSVLAGEDHCEPVWDTVDVERSERERLERLQSAQQGQDVNMDRRPEGAAIFGFRVHRRDHNTSGRPSGNSQPPQSNPTPFPALDRLDRLGDAWVGRALMEAAESREPEGARRLAREGSSGGATSAAHNEDDIAGMQHIVRTLARREDIPPEWWAAVGLNRI